MENDVRDSRSKYLEFELPERDEPMEFAKLKRLYDETLQQFVDLLKRVDPAITRRLQRASETPKKSPEILKTVSFHNEEYHAISTERPQTNSYNVFPEHTSLIFEEEPETESSLGSTLSEIHLADAPKATTFMPTLTPILLNLLPPIANAVGQYLQDITDDNKSETRSQLSVESAMLTSIQGFVGKNDLIDGRQQPNYQQQFFQNQGSPIQGQVQQGYIQPQTLPSFNNHLNTGTQAYPSGQQGQNRFLQTPYPHQNMLYYQPTPSSTGVFSGHNFQRPNGPFQQQTQPSKEVYFRGPQGYNLPKTQSGFQQDSYQSQTLLGQQTLPQQGSYQPQTSPDQTVLHVNPPSQYQSQIAPGFPGDQKPQQGPYQPQNPLNQEVIYAQSQTPYQAQTASGKVPFEFQQSLQAPYPYQSQTSQGQISPSVFPQYPYQLKAQSGQVLTGPQQQTPQQSPYQPLGTQFGYSQNSTQPTLTIIGKGQHIPPRYQQVPYQQQFPSQLPGSQHPLTVTLWESSTQGNANVTAFAEKGNATAIATAMPGRRDSQDGLFQSKTTPNNGSVRGSPQQSYQPQYSGKILPESQIYPPTHDQSQLGSPLHTISPDYQQKQIPVQRQSGFPLYSQTSTPVSKDFPPNKRGSLSTISGISMIAEVEPTANSTPHPHPARSSFQAPTFPSRLSKEDPYFSTISSQQGQSGLPLYSQTSKPVSKDFPPNKRGSLPTISGIPMSAEDEPTANSTPYPHPTRSSFQAPTFPSRPPSKGDPYFSTISSQQEQSGLPLYSQTSTPVSKDFPPNKRGSLSTISGISMSAEDEPNANSTPHPQPTRSPFQPPPFPSRPPSKEDPYFSTISSQQSGYASSVRSSSNDSISLPLTRPQSRDNFSSSKSQSIVSSPSSIAQHTEGLPSSTGLHNNGSYYLTHTRLLGHEADTSSNKGQSSPGRTIISARSFPDFKNINPRFKKSPKETGEFEKLKGEVLKSLKDVDNQIIVILNKLETK